MSCFCQGCSAHPPRHACIPPQGTFLNDRRLVPNVPVRLQPGDLIRLGAAKDSPAFRVKLQHVSMADDVDRSAYGQETDRPLVGV